MFQNEVKHVVLMPSSTNLGINKEVTHNTRQNNKIVGTQYREIQTIIITMIITIIIRIIIAITIIITIIHVNIVNILGFYGSSLISWYVLALCWVVKCEFSCHCQFQYSMRISTI